MSALLFLLYRPGPRALLRAGADLGAVSIAGYFNGHGALEAALRKRQIEARMLDKGFVQAAGGPAAGRASQASAVAPQVGPLRAAVLSAGDSSQKRPSLWSLMQVEYATDIVFQRQQELAPIYEALVRTAVHAVKADDGPRFWAASSAASIAVSWAIIFRIESREAASSAAWAKPPSGCKTGTD